MFTMRCMICMYKWLSLPQRHFFSNCAVSVHCLIGKISKMSQDIHLKLSTTTVKATLFQMSYASINSS
jgi:uncharacterized metal-binding protein